MINHKHIKKLYVAVLAAGVVTFALPVLLFAQARGYTSQDSGLQPGMLVRVSENSPADHPVVERGDNQDPQQIIGVATTAIDSGVVISSTNQEILVVSAGEVTAYVSDIDGSIKKGDMLTVSPLKGIFSKANARSPIIFGTALEDFEGKVTEPLIVKSGEGEKATLIAKIRINFDRKPGGAERVDSSLERIGKAVVGKDVSEIRVITAMVVFLMVLVAEGGILYGAITSAITALGRNPLARESIKFELLRVIAITVTVLIVGLLAIYSILWF